MDNDKSDVAERLEDSKARFADKLSELGRRVDSLQDRTHALKAFASRPLVGFAAAAALGLWLGSRRPRAARSGTPSVVSPPGILRAVFREILVVAAGSATRNYINKHLTGA